MTPHGINGLERVNSLVKHGTSNKLQIVSFYITPHVTYGHLRDSFPSKTSSHHYMLIKFLILIFKTCLPLQCQSWGECWCFCYVGLKCPKKIFLYLP
jgi:hypothetical protein